MWTVKTFFFKVNYLGDIQSEKCKGGSCFGNYERKTLCFVTLIKRNTLNFLTNFEFFILFISGIAIIFVKEKITDRRIISKFLLNFI